LFFCLFLLSFDDSVVFFSPPVSCILFFFLRLTEFFLNVLRGLCRFFIQPISFPVFLNFLFFPCPSYPIPCPFPPLWIRLPAVSFNPGPLPGVKNSVVFSAVGLKFFYRGFAPFLWLGFFLCLRPSHTFQTRRRPHDTCVFPPRVKSLSVV